MRFTIDVVVNERVRSVELLPGGRNKLVTDLNKEEYVRLAVFLIIIINIIIQNFQLFNRLARSSRNKSSALRFEIRLS
jgi:hypothetical protein